MKPYSYNVTCLTQVKSQSFSSPDPRPLQPQHKHGQHTRHHGKRRPAPIFHREPIVSAHLPVLPDDAQPLPNIRRRERVVLLQVLDDKLVEWRERAAARRVDEEKVAARCEEVICGNLYTRE